MAIFQRRKQITAGNKLLGRAVDPSCPENLSYKAITCPTNPEDVNQFICCGRDNKAYPERKRMIAGKWDGG